MSNVFYLIDHFKDPYAGTEGQLYALIQSLVEKNITTELGVFRNSTYIESGEFPCPVKVLNIDKMFSFFTLITLVKLALYLRRNDFKLVHIFFNDASVIAPILLKCFGLKVIISRRDMGFWYTNVLKKILRINSKFVDACICNSQAVKQITVDSEGYKAENVHVVYNGLPAHKFKLDQTFDRHSGENKLHKTVGIVANIRPVKRMPDLIKAISFVKKEISNIKLIIVGDGDNTELALLAKQLNVLDNIEFAGAQSAVAPFIRQFDVAVLSSESEGLSNAIIEYMVYGKPVVCSRVGGNPELIEHEVNGLLYDVGNVEQLAEALKILLNDISKCQVYGNNGRDKVEKAFSIQQMVSNTLSIYKKFSSSIG